LEQLCRCLSFYENGDVFKEIEKGKLKRENVGIALQVFIMKRNNLQYNTDLQILR